MTTVKVIGAKEIEFKNNHVSVESFFGIQEVYTYSQGGLKEKVHNGNDITIVMMSDDMRLVECIKKLLEEHIPGIVNS